MNTNNPPSELGQVSQPVDPQVWFIRSLAQESGGLDRVADALVAMFPDRLKTHTMVKLGPPQGGSYAESVARLIRGEIEGRPDLYLRDLAIKSVSENAVKPIPPQARRRN
jgi:hypothetical protein